MRHSPRFAAAALAAFLASACGAAHDAVGPTEPSSAGSALGLKTLQVAPSRVECTGVGPQMCLQVRESSDRPWTLLYGEIVGFDHEPGYLYEIRVKEEAVANPPADGSSVRRTLVSVLSKTPVSASVLGTTWRLVSIDGREALAGVRVTAHFGDDDRVSGSAGCNGYFGRAAVKGEQVTVGVLAATLMACGAPGVMAQEQAYLSALRQATVHRVTGGELQLGPARGVVTLVYKVE